MARRFDLGRTLLALGGGLLVASLFVDWYGGRSGWTVFEALDILLAALGVAALWAAASPGDTPEWLGPASAALALFIVSVQLIEPPPAAGVHADRQVGAWLALVASLLMVAGAALAFARFAITVEVREHDARRRVDAVDHRMRPADPDRTESMPALADDPDADDGT